MFNMYMVKVHIENDTLYIKPFVLKVLLGVFFVQLPIDCAFTFFQNCSIIVKEGIKVLIFKNNGGIEMLYYTNSLIKRLGNNLVYYRTKEDIGLTAGILLLEKASDYDPDFLCIATPNVCLEVLRTYDVGFLICAGDSEEVKSVVLNNNITLFITDLDMIPLANLLNKFYRDHSASRSGKNSFQRLFSRIISGTGDSDESLMLDLRSLPLPVKKNMRLIIIRSEAFLASEGEGPLISLLTPVRSFFPNANIAVMPDEIVVLLSSETQYCPLEFEKSDFEKILSENHAVAMIGNPFTSLNAMRVMYSHTRRMLPIALAVKLPDEIRCMTFARYTQYNVIDICAKAIPEFLHSGDVVFLCHPGVLALTRYDRAFGTNMRDVMFHYLMNDRNIARTGKKLFMHRNTLIYKVKKIEELIGESMDDPYLRHNLIFSCLLLRYREMYQKEGISLTTFEPPKKKH